MDLITQATCTPVSEYSAIPLTQGKVALVDPSEFLTLMQWKWFAHCDHSTGRFYAARLVTVGKKKQKYVSMHRFLMGFPPCKVDHRDRDGLHNWQLNLRLANDQQNAANSRTQSNNTSGFRGVSFFKDGRRLPWHAYIIDNQKQIYLGSHDTAEAAARAHDKASFALRGEFASLNFPEIARDSPMAAGQTPCR
jgi:hypothetical protein